MLPDYTAPLSTLEVHLDAVARNWLFLKKKLQNGADCAAVVKADGYGLGAAEVARALYAQGCRHFFVAHFSEALVVKQALAPVIQEIIPANSAAQPDPHAKYARNDASIYVLNGPWGASADDFVHYGFIPVLNGPADVAYWSLGAKKPALLHIDTGMSRLGLTPEQAQTLADNRVQLRNIDVRYVMSHLACGDESQHPKNAEQLALFKRLTAALEIPARYSFANSAGIMLGSDYHFDLVRPGCALYGIHPNDAAVNPMQGTVTLRGRVVQRRDIGKSETVGYGAGYKTASPAKCATVSIGYADGYLRSLTGGGHVFIHGEKCPVIGRVSMDSIIIDVTSMKKETVAGDWAEIIGPHQTVDEVARQAGTIGYEILTSLGKRYKRTYTGQTGE